MDVSDGNVALTGVVFSLLLSAPTNREQVDLIDGNVALTGVSKSVFKNNS